ncbi:MULTISPECIES: agmatinase [Sutcliffiella]|uniref:Agmatinase n=1 Tax=Sutcliffiella cohnii TaxID=33932 RepID=A0A223KNK9_9BACI|nr:MULTISPECIES: agmatinase [Sutcliffiella]AST90954.1 agmatinase [Sutcliffiella cohnii]WBL16747.1 agmatinase [Sutcliffiella sp. NC1]
MSKKYSPVNSQESPRFSGIKTFMRLPHVKTEENIDFAVVGVPFDTGGSFAVGTRFGPEAVRSMSSLLRPYNPSLSVDIFEHCSGVDYGDLVVNPGYIEDSYKLIEEQLNLLLKNDVVPIMIGGDHSISLPILRAMADRYGPVSLVHFDSHSDTWDSYFGRKYTHGTVFRRAVEENLVNSEKSIQIGMRGSLYNPDDISDAENLGYQVIPTTSLKKITADQLGEIIHERVGNNPVYVSFDIDFLDPAYAPGTGTPEIGGFTTFEAQEFVRQLNGLNLIGFDCVEVLPDRDITRVTSIAAANICYEFISLVASNKRGNIPVPNKSNYTF